MVFQLELLFFCYKMAWLFYYGFMIVLLRGFLYSLGLLIVLLFAELEKDGLWVGAWQSRAHWKDLAASGLFTLPLPPKAASEGSGSLKNSMERCPRVEEGRAIGWTPDPEAFMQAPGFFSWEFSLGRPFSRMEEWQLKRQTWPDKWQNWEGQKYFLTVGHCPDTSIKMSGGVFPVSLILMTFNWIFGFFFKFIVQL